MSEKEMEHMNSIYKKLKTIKFEIIIVSIALFVLGLLLVIFPTASQEIICKGIGVALCVWGVLRLINYFRIAGSEILGSYGLVQGVTLLAFGMFFVIKPGFIAVFLGTALAIIIIVDGILKLQYAVDFYHLESDKWWIELIGAVVMVVIGIIALLNPFSTSSALIVFIGIALMIEGLWDFISLMRIVSVTKKAGKAIKNFKDQVDAVYRESVRRSGRRHRRPPRRSRPPGQGRRGTPTEAACRILTYFFALRMRRRPDLLRITVISSRPG